MLRISGYSLARIAMVMAISGAVAAQEPIAPVAPVKDINLSMGGTDNLKTSIGDHWQQGPINAPTVLNSSMNVAQF